MPEPSLDKIIWQLVATIPAGKIATYGQLAKLAGYPNHARYVGATLKMLPKDSSLPWFRVVNAQGKISLPENSSAYTRQRHLLEADGIEFSANKIPLRHYQWLQD